MEQSEKNKKLVADHQNFMTALGVCISRWSGVDAWLFRIFRTAIGGSNQRCSSLFYRSPQIREHLELADIVVSDAIENEEGTDALATEWESAKKQFSDLIPFRNQIAHNPVIFGEYVNDVYWQNHKQGEPLLGDPSFRLVTEVYKMHKRKRDKIGKVAVKQIDVIKLEDLNAHTSLVGKLEVSLVGTEVELMRVLKKLPAIPPELNPTQTAQTKPE